MKSTLRHFAMLFILVVLFSSYQGPADHAVATNEKTVQISQNNRTAPNLSTQERLSLAFPAIDIPWGSELNRLVQGNELDWPEMHYLNEGIELRGRTVTPTNVRVVPAGNTVQIYNPPTDEMLDATDVLEKNRMKNRPRVIDFLFIPPGGSLIMIEIKVDPGVSCSIGDYSNPLSGKDFRISYPGLGEHQIAYSPVFDDPSYEFGEYNSIYSNCVNSGWLYFYLPSLEIDPSKLWLEHISEHPEPVQMGFWTLVTRDNDQ